MNSIPTRERLKNPIPKKSYQPTTEQRMKTKDLIKLLSKFNPNSEVSVQNDNHQQFNLEVKGHDNPVLVIFPEESEE